MASDISLSSGTSGLLSGTIKWSGLASGVDFGSVVDQLIEIEKNRHQPSGTLEKHLGRKNNRHSVPEYPYGFPEKLYRRI